MDNFAAIDFETANFERGSACSVGVVVVRDGKVADTFYSLIQPEPNYYNYWCTRVHGLTRKDTDDAPIFPEECPRWWRACLWWRTTAPSMKDASRASSKYTRWTTPTTISTTR